MPARAGHAHAVIATAAGRGRWVVSTVLACRPLRAADNRARWALTTLEAVLTGTERVTTKGAATTREALPSVLLRLSGVCFAVAVAGKNTLDISASTLRNSSTKPQPLRCSASNCKGHI